MIQDLELTPGLILAMWAAGMAAAAAAVAWWRIVGRAFFWVAAGATLLVGAATVVGGGAAAWIGVGGLIAAAATAGRPGPTAAAFAVATAGFWWVAASTGGAGAATTGTLALGGVTVEMLLGHWFLVNPRLPRWALRRLAYAGIVGLVADAVLLVVGGATAGSGGVVFWAFAGLAAMSVLLMTGVWFSLEEPSYTGVMAATGLSYLAVLTSLGAVVVGRALLAGTGGLGGALAPLTGVLLWPLSWPS